jgi:hypothetical protein
LSIGDHERIALAQAQNALKPMPIVGIESAFERRLDYAGMRDHRSNLKLGRVFPEIFEIVELAGFGLKEMQHKLATIDQYPVRGLIRFKSDTADVGNLDEFGHGIGKGLHMRAAVAGSDYEIIGIWHQTDKVEHNKVFDLLVFERLDNYFD